MSNEHLIIVGNGPLAWEIARLGVAYGADVTFVGPTDHGPTNEPWVEGVRWLEHELSPVPSLDELASGNVVWAADETPSDEWAADRRFASRFVVVNGADHAPDFEHFVRVETGEVDLTPLADDDDSPGISAVGGDTLRVETAAMALLRLAIEETAPSFVDRAAVAHLGDAVMWQ